MAFPVDTHGTGRAAAPATILIVDDNPVNLQVLLGTLNGRGYRLLVARDGATALDIARRARPDLVLLDVLMPGMGGFDVCRALKREEALREAPVIFLSALGEVADKVAGLSIGAVDYITKPIQAEEVLARVDVHLTRARLEHELRTVNDRLNRELTHAAEMQRRILPPRLPDTPAIRFAAHYRTSRFAGGDYYDVLPLPGGRYAVITLDVSGHGAPAAIVMAMMRTVVHTFGGPIETAGALLRHIHDHFHFLGETSVYATAVSAIVDPAASTIHVACAGHPRPLRFRPGAGVSPLEGQTTTPLLLMPLHAIPEAEHRLEPGDRVLFYTDGVTDRETPEGTSYDVERLGCALEQAGTAPVESAVAAIVSDVETFTEGAEPADDNTLLLMGIS